MTEPAPRSAAAAWAAAAVVLAVGALGFAIAQHVRADGLASRLDRLEASAATTTVAAPPPTTRAPTTSTTSAGLTEPPDPERARRDVEGVVAQAYDGRRGPAERAAAVDDPAGVEEALGALFRGPYAVGARTSSAVVTEVGFTSATRATIAYTVSVAGAPALAERRGEARVSGGGWKVTRETICADLAALDAPCP